MIATPGWFLDGVIHRISKEDPEAGKLFYPKSPDGRPHDVKHKFVRNMLAALYTANPGDYLEDPQ